MWRRTIDRALLEDLKRNLASWNQSDYHVAGRDKKTGQMAMFFVRADSHTDAINICNRHIKDFRAILAAELT